MEPHECIKAHYSVAIEVAKPAAVIFNHLTHDVSKFWPEEFSGQSSQPDDVFEFRSGNDHYSKNKVIELVPGKKITWLVTDSIRKKDNYSWTGTRMIFELVPVRDNTRIEFTYDGPVPANEYERLMAICDMVIKDKLYNFINNAG